MSGGFNKWACIAAALLLAGCGSDYPDQAEISVVGEVDTSIFDQSRPGRVYYFDEAAINESIELQQFKSALTEWLASPGDQLPDVEFPDDAEQIWEATEAFQEQRDNGDAAWRANLDEDTAPLKAELDAEQSTLAQLEETKAAFDEALAPADQKIATLQARIDETVERQAEMARTVVEGWNNYILENDLAVRTLDPERSRVFSYGGRTRTESCPSADDAVTVDRLEEEDTCYQLWLPNEVLHPAPINEQYAAFFDEYRELTELRGRPYRTQGETETLNQQLQEAREKRTEDLIRAENRHGNHRQLERELGMTERRVASIQQRIENADSDWAKKSFERNRMREYHNNVQQQLDSYVAVTADDIIKSIASSDISIASTFPLEHQAELLVFDLPISTFMGTGNLLTLKDMREPVEEKTLDVVLSEANTEMVSQRALFTGIIERVALEAEQFEKQ
ncbi:hypothetical protein [Vreelandella zhanjiangensis]|uniref:hypothetical protein n=1 Tax=Vreelandella zhanjiangensis TaxID=1121960 RepID=UPI0003795685|nr:hypothetical protein [Halomonas zhanjiangensis]